MSKVCHSFGICMGIGVWSRWDDVPKHAQMQPRNSDGAV
ncbi:Hypothetical protein RAK1035_2555 [Roseovarius sp. AK1035]|nr:Hypothetical protein RAK1035_2555 [Roseovarius sp. AK1035]